MDEQTIQLAVASAIEVAEWQGGHKLGEMKRSGTFGLSAECVRPGCNMGLTIVSGETADEVILIGAAARFHCASTSRPLIDPVTLVYRPDPLEGK